VHAGPDFLDRRRDEPPSGVAIFSGRNRGAIDRIIAALEAGLHVLADKPAIIEPADLKRLEAALTMANEWRLMLANMMTGRHNTVVRLLQALGRDPEVFGDPVPGTGDELGVLLSVHIANRLSTISVPCEPPHTRYTRACFTIRLATRRSPDERESAS
jgi:hypothetical protein